MALEVYFRADIAQGITAVTVAMLSASVANGGTNVEYCRGVLDAARAQALAYGIEWSILVDKLRADLQAPELLDIVAGVLVAGEGDGE